MSQSRSGPSLISSLQESVRYHADAVQCSLNVVRCSKSCDPEFTACHRPGKCYTLGECSWEQSVDINTVLQLVFTVEVLEEQ